MHAGLCKNISTYVHTRSNVFFSFDIGTSIWYSFASNVCIYSISVFLSFHFAIKFKAEMRNSNITESNLSVPRIAVIDAGQEKWITEWTNGYLNNFRPLSFFSLLFFFLSIAMRKKVIDNCFIGSTWFSRPIDYARSHTTTLKLCTKSQCFSRGYSLLARYNLHRRNLLESTRISCINYTWLHTSATFAHLASYLLHRLSLFVSRVRR